jgi:hypothetical protein
MSPKRKLGIDPLFDSRQAKLAQTEALALCLRRGLEVFERLATPKLKCLLELLGRSERISARKRLFPSLHEPLEAVEIDRVWLGLEEIAGRTRDDPLRSEDLAEPGHIDLQRARSRLRRTLAPDRIDQAITGDDPIAVQNEDGEYGSLPRASDSKEPAAPLDLEWAEHPKFKRIALRPVTLHRAETANKQGI